MKTLRIVIWFILFEDWTKLEIFSEFKPPFKVPNPIILKYIPDLLDPMFLFLTDDKHEIYVRCQRELLVFLHNIQNNPPQPEEFVKIVNSLVVHVQSGMDFLIDGRRILIWEILLGD